MKIGLYIPHLGQSLVNEPIEKYSERLMNEMSFNTNGIEYEIKTEKINYTVGKESTVVSIYEKNQQSKLAYKIYDFKYHEILKEKFNSHSLILKNLWLLLLVFKKIPLIIKRLFSPESYNRPFQMLYLLFILILITFSVLLTLPAIFDLISESKISEAVLDLKNNIYRKDIPYISQAFIETVSEKVSPKILSIMALLLLLVPNANILIANLATEFVCANDYLEHGVQRQLLQGNLDLLVDYITEKEKDCKIHFHTYSFGSILAIDYIYPFGNKVSKNAEQFCEALITIATPFEFINSYYPQFYENRKTELGDKLHWLNVYSIADALATNFRKDSKIGDAEFGIEKSSNKPTNINYEVSPIRNGSVIDFFMLHSVKVHGMYWDSKPEGQSCLRLVYEEMHKRNLL